MNEYKITQIDYSDLSYKIIAKGIKPFIKALNAVFSIVLYNDIVVLNKQNRTISIVNFKEPELVIVDLFDFFIFNLETKNLMLQLINIYNYNEYFILKFKTQKLKSWYTIIKALTFHKLMLKKNKYDQYELKLTFDT